MLHQQARIYWRSAEPRARQPARARPRLRRRAPLRRALAAIRAYGEAHLQHFGLPGMTLSVVTPDGFARSLNFGFANADARTPITPDTLFQIGSISKVMRQRCSTSSPPKDGSPDGPDQRHAAGHPACRAGTRSRSSICSTMSRAFPGRATFPDGGLWTAYAPGQHWHYSNTGYDILGKLAEHIGGKPLARCCRSYLRAVGHEPHPRRHHRRRPATLRARLRGCRPDAVRARSSARAGGLGRHDVRCGKHRLDCRRHGPLPSHTRRRGAGTRRHGTFARGRRRLSRRMPCRATRPA